MTLSTTSKLVIDTGSSVTLLSSRIFFSIPQSMRPLLQYYQGKLILADGSDLPVLGEVNLPLCFGSITVHHSVLVADIKSDGLIGIDFMKEHSCELSYENGTFSIQGRAIPFTEETGSSMSCRITAAQTDVVPPLCEYIAEGIIQRRGKDELTEQAVVEPVQSFQNAHGLLVGSLLVESGKGTIPLIIMIHLKSQW